MFFNLENVKRNFDSWVEQKPFGKTDSRKAKKQYYFPLLWKTLPKLTRQNADYSIQHRDACLWASLAVEKPSEVSWNAYF